MLDSKKRHYLSEYLLWAVAVVFFAVIVYILFCREVFLSEEMNWFWVNGGIGIAFFYSFFYCLFLIFSASAAQRWKEPEEKDNISGVFICVIRRISCICYRNGFVGFIDDLVIFIVYFLI